jgi:hypothetical protein
MQKAKRERGGIKQMNTPSMPRPCHFRLGRSEGLIKHLHVSQPSPTRQRSGRGAMLQAGKLRVPFPMSTEATRVSELGAEETSLMAWRVLQLFSLRSSSRTAGRLFTKFDIDSSSLTIAVHALLSVTSQIFVVAETSRAKLAQRCEQHISCKILDLKCSEKISKLHFRLEHLIARNNEPLAQAVS